MATKKEKTVLVMRTCNADMTSSNGFRWPRRGKVEAPDWSPVSECGHGLHGLLRGCGDGSLLSWADDAVWVAVRVFASEVVEIGADKCKFPRGTVVKCGTRDQVTAHLAAIYPGTPIVGSTVTGGDYSTVTGGYGSTVTGGYGSTVTGGYYSTVTGGYCSTVTGGDGSTVTGGDGSTVTGGDCSTVTGGDCSTVTGGYGSTVTGGYGSTILSTWYDGDRYRVLVGYVGEDGIRANIAYRVDGGKWVEA